MRVLCLNLQQNQEASSAEVFLKFSPRVQFRYPHYVFVDVESTAGLFGGEMQLLKKAVDTARQFAPSTTGAIADSAAVAQLLVKDRPFEITRSGEDFKQIARLPVTSLVDLEGLDPWPQKRQIEQMAHSLQSIGLYWIEDLMHLSLEALRARWGDVGQLLWRRLRNQDVQVISPLSSQEPLLGYGYFDEAVSTLSHLREKLDPQMNYLFLRMEGLGRMAQRLEARLFCEYSETKHHLVIEPVTASRDLKLYKDLLLKKLESVDLQNPIKEFEIHVLDVPEKIQQMDFFEPRDSTEDRWRRLISFSRQAQVEVGFLQSEAAHLPEKSYSLKTDWPVSFSPKDLVEWAEKAISVKSVFAKGLAKAPRPSLLLKDPLTLSKMALDRLKVLTRIPTERIQASWWKNLEERDYYFALSREGQLLWIFQDLKTEKYFLQGYFD
jgi:protein ImuB